MDKLLPGIVARADPDGTAGGGGAVGQRPDRPGRAVRARQRLVVAVLGETGHAGAARGVPAAGDRPARVRRHRPGAGRRDPRAARLRGRPGRRHRRTRPGVGAPDRLEHGRRCGPAVPDRTARHSPGRVADAGRPGVPVRVRRDQGRGGILCDPRGAGSGGGSANPEFVERLAGQDRGDTSVLSPRQVLLAHYVKPPHVPEHLDIFVESMLSTRSGTTTTRATRGPRTRGRASHRATAAY